MDGTNIGPNSPPIPIPSVAKVPRQGAEQIGQIYFDIFRVFYKGDSNTHQYTIKQTTNIIYWVVDGTNIGPYFPPSPTPMVFKLFIVL